MNPRIAVDTGGTFTDFVAEAPNGTRVTLKLPSTPADPGAAVRKGIEEARAAGAGPFEAVLHGTTVATNALLERRGARVVLIATQGFEDVLRLRRQNRPHLYALHPETPPPLVPPERCVGVQGRLGPNGERWAPLEDLERWADRNRDVLSQAEAFAICLMHAYIDPRDEIAVAGILARHFPEVPVTCSHRLVPLAREFERASTVAVNAFVGPVMQRYLEALETQLAPARLAVMASSGGLVASGRASAEPVRTVLSGPAGGVRGAWAVGHRCARRALLSLDMGGTSTDVSVLHGHLAPDDEGALGEHPLRVPLLPIETVGAGGGSIAWVDPGGALQVGPHSAGSVPGPAAYGQAGLDAAATVTDANVVLGRLPALLGGSMTLDRTAAREAIARLAKDVGSSVEETAEAVVRIAESTMTRACKRVTLERGIDPRTLTLVAFGGAGGLHACALADALGCRDVIFPSDSGVLSAEGMLEAPHEAVRARSVFTDEKAWSDAHLEAAREEILNTATADLQQDRPGAALEEGETEVLFDCRYRGQTYTLPIPWTTVLRIQTPGETITNALRAAFDAEHQHRYGYALGPERPVEWVAIRALVRDRSTTAPSKPPETVGELTTGPHVVPAYSATLWIPPGWQAIRLDTGDHLCTRVPEKAGELDSPHPLAEPLALEIHREQLASIAEEMGVTLMKAAFSANIKERRDFSCAVFDRDGTMIVQAAHIPVHLGSQPMSVAAACAAVPMRPGVDVVLNDPYAGGTHLPDVTLVSPVFLNPEDPTPTFFVANRAHHADVGGRTPGSMPSANTGGLTRGLTIDDEGWRSPPVALTETVRCSFADASRTPEERYGDLRAQEAANRRGQQRLQELVQNLGLARIEALNRALLDYTERRMRAVIAEIPSGVYRFEDCLDNDGDTEAPVPLPLVMTVDDDRVVLDFRAAPDARPGSLNAVRAITGSAAFYVFRCLAGATMPSNAGLMRPVEVLTRPGSVCDALPPAAVSAGNVETSQRLVDVIFGALAQACPDRVPAASGGSMNNVLFGGRDPRPGPTQGQPFVHYETLACGAGASRLGPGADAIHVHMTNTLNTPVEALEREFPVRISNYGVRSPNDAPASGFYRGGAGVCRAYQFLAEAEVTVISERRTVKPWAIGAAPAGTQGRNTLVRTSGERIDLGGKAHVNVQAGDTLVVETPGGGGWAPKP